MSVVQTTDVLQAVKVRWTGDRTLAELVPGGLHFEQPPLTRDGRVLLGPWARIEITEGAPEFNSSATYVQPFTLQVSVWTEAGGVDAGKVAAALDLLFNRPNAPEEWQVPGADRVLDLLPKPGSFKVDQVKREATDQLVTAKAWDLFVQATR